MSPQRLVAILLEADDMLPQPSPEAPDPEAEAGIDTKSFTAKVVDGVPLNIHGTPIQGLHAMWAGKFQKWVENPKRHLRRDGPTEYFKIDNNTLLVRDTFDGSISVKFHHTDILTVSPDDTLTVNNGGWRTMTTLSRMNDWLPVGWGIYMHKGTWYWRNYRHSDEELNPGLKRTQPYSNGDSITADGILRPLVGPEFKKTRVPHRADF